MLRKLFNKETEHYKVKDLMTKNIVTIHPEDDLYKTHTIMSKYRIKKLVVTPEGNRKIPVGIITIRDILKFLIADKTDRDLDEIQVSEVMTKDLITTHENTSVVGSAKILNENKNISSLIATKNTATSGQTKPSVVGIITITDFTRFYSENCIGLAEVKNYMSREVFTISIAEKVSKATQMMVENTVHQLLVTGPKANSNVEQLLGVLTESDIINLTPILKSRSLRSVYEEMEWLFKSTRKTLAVLEPDQLHIQEIFTPNTTIVTKNEDLAGAAKIMVKQGIDGIPVIETLAISSKDEGKQPDKPLGVVSKFDVVRALSALVPN